jgi:DNA-binding protein HU-beta
MAKTKTVSKADLVDALSTDLSIQKKNVKEVVDGMLKLVIAHLNEGNKVQLTGFGTFEVRERKERTGVKPGTTDKIQIPASKYPAFKPGKSLKQDIK